MLAYLTSWLTSGWSKHFQILAVEWIWISTTKPQANMSQVCFPTRTMKCFQFGDIGQTDEPPGVWVPMTLRTHRFLSPKDLELPAELLPQDLSSADRGLPISVALGPRPNPTVACRPPRSSSREARIRVPTFFCRLLL